MNTKVKEKIAYLRGLIDGQNVKDDQQRAIYSAILETLDEIALKLDDHAEAIEDIDDSVVDIYDAIDELEDTYDFDDEDFVELECPHCGETVFFDHDMLAADELICPNCNENIDILGTDDDDE